MNMRHTEQPLNGVDEKRSDTPTGYTEKSGNNGVRFAVRKPIQDAPGYTISTDGTPRKWGRKLDIHKGPGGLPAVYVDGRERFLDEIVAYAFFGPPPTNIRGMDVHHFDADPLNCAVTNLAWRVCPEWREYVSERSTKRDMRPDHLPVMPRRIPPDGMRPTRRTFYF